MLDESPMFQHGNESFVSCEYGSPLLIGRSRSVPAHKYQVRTFDQVMVEYDSAQQIQLVYVTFIRVTTIEELYYVNKRSIHKFHSVWLQRHQLPALSYTMRTIISQADSSSVFNPANA
ncbi:hypothetical protein CEXT_235101 [Caerostris extrusa]|uniref:Uncharacterized protein n=1 Tax=Caerostris extrusa TaxID=172846 RepID=A0AAV4NN20_CAEEX|nr:hypothetical protein CEXT_235101 [Caerostris extrusa]